ncbi:MAG: hypothetical protein ACJAVK_000545 [Akkermansiaceae bacterium]|jgi:hypothetical protein
MSRLVSIFALGICSLSAEPPLKRPAPELLVIDNGTVEIGIAKAMGAAITHLTWRALDQKNILKLWDMPDEEASALMKQWTTFEEGFQNVIVVKNEIICRRKPGDAWGPANKSPQEVPALYFTRNFNTFKSHLGDAQWRLKKQPPGPPWGRTTSPKHAMACFEKSGQGIAIFSPSAVSWNFGPHRSGTSSDHAAAPCCHIAPVARVNLGPQSTLSYRYWLIIGTEKKNLPYSRSPLEKILSRTLLPHQPQVA